MEGKWAPMAEGPVSDSHVLTGLQELSAVKSVHRQMLLGTWKPAPRPLLPSARVEELASLVGGRRRWPRTGASCRSSVLERRAHDLLGVAEALAGEAEDRGLVDEAIDGGDGARLRREEMLPAGEAGVGGEDDGRLAIPGGDEAVEVVGGLLVEAAGVAELVEEQHLRLGVATERALEGAVGVGGLEVLEHVGGGDAQGRIAGDAGGVGDGLGDPGLAQARLADAQDVALLLDEAAVTELLDDAGLEVRAFEAAFATPRDAGLALAAEEDEREVGVGEALLLGAGEVLLEPVGERGEVEVEGELAQFVPRFLLRRAAGVTRHGCRPPRRAAWWRASRRAGRSHRAKRLLPHRGAAGPVRRAAMGGRPRRRAGARARGRA